MTCRLSLAACDEYDLEQVKHAVANVLAYHEPLSGQIKPGSTVLLKPNLLNASAPARAVTTHPTVFEAVAALCLDFGARVQVGDSSGYGSMGDKMKATGIGDVARRLGVEIVTFDGAVRLAAHDSSIHRRIEVARVVAEADAIINLPKVKTHSQMLLTVAVKNMFGCIVGARKPQWHFKSTGDCLHFGTMLVELFERLGPVMTLVDGVVGMEGNGPGSGTPRKLGVIAAGTDAVALDALFASLLGVDPATVPVLQAAKKLGVGTWDLDHIELCGDPHNNFVVPDWKPAKPHALDFGLPRPVQSMVRKTFIPRPVVDPALCTVCNDCVTVWPTDVITIPNGRLAIDYEGCIDCFLCEAFCPENAISERVGLLATLLAPGSA